MGQWNEIYFDDFIKLNRGFDLPNDKIEEGIYPVAASTSIKAYHNEYKVKGPGVVTGRSGSLGTVQYIKDDYWPLNTSLYVKDFKGNDPKFVAYFLGEMHLENFNSGAGVPTLNQNHLHKLKIAVPNVDEQRRIASILSSYDELIETNSRRIALLEESARELYKEWFVRFRFPGHENAKFVNGLPEGWEEERIDKYYKTGSGGTPNSKVKEYYENGNIRWINTGELHDSYILDTNVKITDLGLNKSAAKMYPSNTVVIAMYGATIGKLGIMSEDCCTNQACCCLIPKTEVYDNFFLFLSLFIYRPFLVSFGIGAAQQNISQEEIKKFKIVYPAKNILEMFSKSISNIFETIKEIQLQNASLSKTRDLLLPRLISGKIKV